MRKSSRAQSVMATKAFKLWFFLIIGLVVVALKSASGGTDIVVTSQTSGHRCQPAKRDLLRRQLGNAYNQRYMAMDGTDLLYKAKQSPFANTEHVTKRKNVTKRSITSIDQITDAQPWTCQTTKVWLDLGAKHFPRFVRSVTCSSSTCWFQHFRCRPMHYKIDVLKKKDGMCLRVYSSAGLPEWVDFWKPAVHEITVGCKCGL